MPYAQPSQNSTLLAGCGGATQEAKAGELQVQSQSGQLSETLIQNKKGWDIYSSVVKHTFSQYQVSQNKLSVAWCGVVSL